MALNQDNHTLPNPKLEQVVQSPPPQIKIPGEFTLFPSLPPEIRLRVWKLLIVTGSRHVDLLGGFVPIPNPDGLESGRENYRQARKDAKRTFPQTLHVNQESRFETLNTLSFVFPCSNQPEHILHLERGFDSLTLPLWVDLKSDTVYISWINLFAEGLNHWALGTIVKHAPELLRAVRKLEIRGAIISTDGDILFSKYMLASLLCFSSLEVLDIALAVRRDASLAEVNALKQRIKTWLNEKEFSSLKDTLLTIHVRKLKRPYFEPLVLSE